MPNKKVCPHCDGDGEEPGAPQRPGERILCSHCDGTGEYDVTRAIIDYENGESDAEDTRTLFQHLVNSGLAWRLQGHYGRTAKALIETGEISSGEPG